MKLGIGTSNDNWQGTYNSASTASNAGADWYSTVDAVYRWAVTQGITSQVQFWAASDMETEWGPAPYTNDWSTAYAEADTGSVFDYWDYGDAGGCSWTVYTNSPCNTDWHQLGVWYASYGPAPAFPFPITYYAVNAEQWWRISQYSYYEKGAGAILIQGPLTEVASGTLSNSTAWGDLSTYLADDSHTNLPMS